MNFVYRVRDRIGYLRSFIAERVDQALGPEDVVYVVKTIAREILPSAGFKNALPQLELFGDWISHYELDRSPAGQRAIAKIAEALGRYDEGGHDNKWLEEQVNDAISFPSLRLELIAVCRHFDFPEGMFTTWEAWQRFAVPLAFEVSGRAVRVGQDGRHAKEARERIAVSGLSSEHHPHTLTLVLIEGGGPQVDGWRWEVRMRMGKIIIQLLLGGFRLSDFPVPTGWQSPI